jgi:hypothetical protein
MTPDQPHGLPVPPDVLADEGVLGRLDHRGQDVRHAVPEARVGRVDLQLLPGPPQVDPAGFGDHRLDQRRRERRGLLGIDPAGGRVPPELPVGEHDQESVRAPVGQPPADLSVHPRRAGRRRRGEEHEPPRGRQGALDRQPALRVRRQAGVVPEHARARARYQGLPKRSSSVWSASWPSRAWLSETKASNFAGGGDPPRAALEGPTGSSATQNVQPGGAGGQEGSGRQPGVGDHPGGAGGQFGGGLKRSRMAAPDSMALLAPIGGVVRHSRLLLFGTDRHEPPGGRQAPNGARRPQG